MVPSSFTVQAFRVTLLWMSAPSARVLTFAAKEMPKALNCQPFAEALSSAAQTAADNDGLTVALPRRVLFCEMLGRMRRRTGLLRPRAPGEKEISFHSSAVGRTKLCQMRGILQKNL